jgi:gliding motility-associated-like protein
MKAIIALKKPGIAVMLLFFSSTVSAQVCSSPGQTPASAILVCGPGAVIKTSVPLCGQSNIPVPCSDGGVYQNANPYWYKMSCQVPGTLGFTITPDDMSENFDWQLFDVTGRNPDDVFTNPGLFIACNWSSDPGETGASVDGTSLVVCSGIGQPLFSQMPNLQSGHEYFLLVSHRDATTNGFTIVFGGGTASIVDPLEPKLTSARLSCDGTQVIVKLNRGMVCWSMATDGTDFTITGGATVTAAFSTGCASNPTTDSVVLSLASPLPSGNYVLTIRDGSDGNSLIDICGRGIPAGQNVSFTVAPLLPTPLDSINATSCAPSVFQLIFQRPIRCNSIAGNGTDFTITGPQSVSITGVLSSCNSGLNPPPTTSYITLQLSSPIITAGIYTVTLTTGSDGNTIIDECGRETPPGSTVSKTLGGAVSASFTYTIKPSCKTDTLLFSHDGNNGVTSWNWTFDNTVPSTLQNPVQIYPASGNHSARLIVSNGFCKDTITQQIKLDNQVIAAFDAPGSLCPGDTITFINRTKGTVDNWLWDFGNGNTSIMQIPVVQLYPAAGIEKTYSIKLVAASTTMNCRDSIVHIMKVPVSCHILVPSAFTPDNNGLNDHLYPLNAIKADKLEFRVYNRSGQLVFYTNNRNGKWDGRINGVLQPTGLYVWTLSFVLLR